MKSNKQRYNDSMQRNGGKGSGNNNGGWVAMFFVLLILLIGLRQCGFILNGSDDGLAGVGQTNPDADEIGRRFR